MPKNEEGEFELILGNRQLLSVFFIVVILLGVFFTMGYIVGRNSTPLVASGTDPKGGSRPPVPDSPSPAPFAPPAPAPAANDAPTPALTETAPQQPESSSAKNASLPPPSNRVAAPKAEPAKPAPLESPQPAAAAKNQPDPGATYLQLAATRKTEADILVDVLRRKGFKAIAAEITEKPDTYRVLVGPVTDGTINLTRSELQKTGFPGNASIRRTF